MSKRSRHAANNRSNQKNPNNSAYWKSRGSSGVPKEGSRSVPSVTPPPATKTVTTPSKN